MAPTGTLVLTLTDEDQITWFLDCLSKLGGWHGVAVGEGSLGPLAVPQVPGTKPGQALLRTRESLWRASDCPTGKGGFTPGVAASVQTWSGPSNSYTCLRLSSEYVPKLNLLGEIRVMRRKKERTKVGAEVLTNDLGFIWDGGLLKFSCIAAWRLSAAGAKGFWDWAGCWGQKEGPSHWACKPISSGSELQGRLCALLGSPLPSESSAVNLQALPTFYLRCVWWGQGGSWTLIKWIGS